MINGDNGGQLGEEIIHSIAAEYNWPDWHPVVRTAVSVDPKNLVQCVGTYALAPNLDVVVTIENETLMMQATGQPKVQLHAASESKFFIIEAPIEVEFTHGGDGQVDSLIVHQGGSDMKAPRK
jgi:hypothetical protein